METRVQAKHQELQDKVSQLLTLMEIQSEGHEQLAAENQQHLKQLFSTQQKMQVDLN